MCEEDFWGGWMTTLMVQEPQFAVVASKMNIPGVSTRCTTSCACCDPRTCRELLVEGPSFVRVPLPLMPCRWVSQCCLLSQDRSSHVHCSSSTPSYALQPARPPPSREPDGILTAAAAGTRAQAGIAPSGHARRAPVAAAGVVAGAGGGRAAAPPGGNHEGTVVALGRGGSSL